LHALAMLFLDLHNYGAIIATIFWGLWLLPLGMLVLKSDLIPKTLGVLLITACFCYLTDVFVFFFFPSYFAATFSALGFVVSLAEVSFILWLLIKGVKN